MTITSQQCAEPCCIIRLVDARWARMVKGVGAQHPSVTHVDQIRFSANAFFYPRRAVHGYVSGTGYVQMALGEIKRLELKKLKVTDKVKGTDRDEFSL